MSTRTGASRQQPARRPRSGRPAPDRAVLWSLVLFLLSFPLMLLFLVLIAYVAELLGVEFGSEEDQQLQGVLNVVYLTLALLPLVAAIIVGLVGWFRRRRRAALAVVVLSAVAIVVFLFVPSVI